MKTRKRLNKILADNTGQSIETIQLDTERDNYMTAEEAKEYGLVDEIILHHGEQLRRDWKGRSGNQGVPFVNVYGYGVWG